VSKHFPNTQTKEAYLEDFPVRPPIFSITSDPEAMWLINNLLGQSAQGE
jgi:hypothetical protein